MLAENRYVVLPCRENLAVMKSGLRRLVVPEMDSFIARDPAVAVEESTDQVPPVPPETDQPVGVPEPDSNDPLGVGFVLVAGSLQR